MKNYLTLLLFLAPLFSIAQQVDKLYTVGGVLYQASSLDGIGINEDRPEAALHINQPDDRSTALRIDLENTVMAIEHGETVYSQPEYAIRINTFSSDYPAQISNLFSIDQNGTTRISYSGSGNEKLMVSNSLGVYKSSSTMVRLGYDGSQNTPQLVWKTSSNQNFQFKNVTSGAIPISLSPSGKVGINTDDFFADHALYVDGSVYIKKDATVAHSIWIEGSSIAEEMFVQIKDGTWGDYVFKDDYLLLPLNDLEKFIEENGHLPEMPTAAEVEEEGVKTGETIRLLTIKVEELTLYLLQQQKEIDALRKEINEK